MEAPMKRRLSRSEDYELQSSKRIKTREEAPVPRIILEPHDHDVLCGRGGRSNSHFGNNVYRRVVEHNKEIYQASSTKKQKYCLALSVVLAIQRLDPPGRFLRKNETSEGWSEVSIEVAFAKTSQALREHGKGKRPGTKSKLIPRSSSWSSSAATTCSSSTSTMTTNTTTTDQQPHKETKEGPRLKDVADNSSGQQYQGEKEITASVVFPPRMALSLFPAAPWEQNKINRPSLCLSSDTAAILQDNPDRPNLCLSSDTAAILHQIGEQENISAADIFVVDPPPPFFASGHQEEEFHKQDHEEDGEDDLSSSVADPLEEVPTFVPGRKEALLQGHHNGTATRRGGAPQQGSMLTPPQPPCSSFSSSSLLSSPSSLSCSEATSSSSTRGGSDSEAEDGDYHDDACEAIPLATLLQGPHQEQQFEVCFLSADLGERDPWVAPDKAEISDLSQEEFNTDIFSEFFA